MGQPKEEIGTRDDLCLYRIQTAKDNGALIMVCMKCGAKMTRVFLFS